MGESERNRYQRQKLMYWGLWSSYVTLKSSVVGTNIQVVCLRKIMQRDREREGGRKRGNFLERWKSLPFLINFSITSRLALSDGALFLQRNVPALYLLRVLISDLVLGKIHTN